MHRVSRTRVA